MIKRTHEITLGKKPGMLLYCLGDVGFSGDRCDRATLESDIRYALWWKSQGWLVKVVGLGDWLAFPSPSERAALIGAKSGKGFYLATLKTLDEAMKERCDDWIKTVMPLKDGFLGTVHGHHLYDFTGEGDGCEKLRKKNSDQYICDELGCRYYGDIGLVKLTFPELKDDQHIIVQHGYGSGRTHGTAVAKRERVFEGFGADIILMGHDNRRMANATNQVHFKGWREKRSVATGAYERAYAVGKAHGGYVEELLLNPSAIGGTMILFQNWEGRLRVRAMV